MLPLYCGLCYLWRVRRPNRRHLTITTNNTTTTTTTATATSASPPSVDQPAPSLKSGLVGFPAGGEEAARGRRPPIQHYNKSLLGRAAKTRWRPAEPGQLGSRHTFFSFPPSLSLFLSLSLSRSLSFFLAAAAAAASRPRPYFGVIDACTRDEGESDKLS